jgi:hypothetical protein
MVFISTPFRRNPQDVSLAVGCQLHASRHEVSWGYLVFSWPTSWMLTCLLPSIITYSDIRVNRILTFHFSKDFCTLGGMEKMTLSFKIDVRIKKWIEKLAHLENRSVSNYVATALIKHLEEKGVNWRHENPESLNREGG